MASYRYQRGDQPLEGYTIEHAVGRGGFGEVYYAVSDSGKQVALKAVQNYEDIELRGSTHCMNLKSPHLVTIFDVRHNERGDSFVIMEYVSGPSLRELLDDSPEGLGPEKSAWFIREIAKGVSMLHDNGIVHRDLKPHNVFYEDGYVMIGDYSLSKVITTSHRSGHTLTVGTVHYMAPEISLGRYDRTVDIYAMGVLLYEMLTGKPPFLGESMGEVLMKHMSQEVDVSSLPQPFATVVQKAMARDPETRYQSVDEMVEALFGTDAVRDGASGFDPGSLTMIARRAVEKSRPMPATVARDSDANKAAVSPKNVVDNRDRRPPGSSPNTPARQHRTQKRNNPNTVPYWVGQVISRATARMAVRSYPEKAILWERSDELSFGIRSLLAAAALFIGSLGIIYLCQATGRPFISPGLESLYIVPLLAISATAGAALAGWLLAFFRIQLPWFVIRGVYCAGCGLPVFVIAKLNHDVASLGADFVIALIMPVLVMDWRWMTSSRRRCRVSVVPSLVAADITLVVSLNMFSSVAHVFAAVGIAATTAMATQLLMPFSESRSHRMLTATDWMASLEGLAECVALDDQHDETVTATSHGTLASSNESMKSPAEEALEQQSAALENDDDWWREADEASAASSEKTFADVATDSQSIDSEPGGAPRARIPALVLSLFPLLLMPLCGLHRFYVGKVYSGTLYLLTLGLFGVGQLIDVILIALGEFRDAEGRLLTAWRSSPDESSTVGEQVNSLSVVPSPKSFFNDGLAVLGGLALAATVMVAFVLAIDVPEMIAADVFRGFDLTGSDLQAIFGTMTWPELLRELLQLLAGIMAVITTGLLLASRRSSGLSHAFKVPVAAIPLGITQALLMEAFFRVSWSRVAVGIEQKKVGLILEEFLRSNDFIPSCIGAAVAFAVGLLILSLPPRREFTQSVAQQVSMRQEV
jgi:serine/threonine protein kinase